MLGNHNGRKPKLTCRSDFPSTLGGFPHSEIHGSKGIRTSPWLIAAYHVLHRLCMPRHPPIALKTLDRSHCQCPPGLLPMSSARKTSFSRSARRPAVKRPIMGGRLSVSRDKPASSTHGPSKSCDFSGPCSDDGVRTNLLFTMSAEQAESPRLAANLFPLRMTRLRPSAYGTACRAEAPKGAKDGGAGRDRTDDPLLAKQVLSQLSYGP
jgi:hypothetical protein